MLASLGAAPVPEGQPADAVPVLVDPLPPGPFGRGLPAGTLEYCTGLALALGALAGVAVSGIGVALQVRLPEVMAEAYRSTVSMRPAPPRPAPGGGWVHADLGAPGDREAFDLLVSTLREPAAADLAAAAQEWRLAVCDYRPAASGPPALPISLGAPGGSGPGVGPAPGAPAAPPRSGGLGAGRLRVLDLTTMWAGPLATWLLRGLGAEVIKVEPSFRPDGLRAVQGGGIHPDDRPCDPGHDSAMWNALNEGKVVVDLDLRHAADRARFLEEAAASDVVIDSFSPRVMPNFGMELPGGPVYVSMPAFPPGRRRDWVAYGTGVHALSGLGDVGGGRYAAPAVSYPDAVAGLTAALAVVAAVTARRRGFPVGSVECPLSASVQPLVAFGPALHRADATPGDGEPILGVPEGIGARLLHLAEAAGRTERRSVCGRPLPHPDTLFPSKQNVF